jgi:hypothetical protein
LARVGSPDVIRRLYQNRHKLPDAAVYPVARRWMALFQRDRVEHVDDHDPWDFDMKFYPLKFYPLSSMRFAVTPRGST